MYSVSLINRHSPNHRKIIAGWALAPSYSGPTRSLRYALLAMQGIANVGQDT